VPVSRITKRTEKVLLMRQKATGLSNPKLIELAVCSLPRIPVRELRVNVTFKRRGGLSE